ncbi:hypothetical protein EDB81DRAFT_862682 [Dactylonectria macrodidyma]|uniref:Uncharacterized protein n=1 Tax=Dactylonectria macrodidyma TaxID=307937 RepID=A0A9P9D500_9HYPO|nr:hypothetical protein EDB81DRAFT_862682 [Dactylonectria macrodidyma]
MSFPVVPIPQHPSLKPVTSHVPMIDIMSAPQSLIPTLPTSDQVLKESFINGEQLATKILPGIWQTEDADASNEASDTRKRRIEGEKRQAARKQDRRLNSRATDRERSNEPQGRDRDATEKVAGRNANPRSASFTPHSPPKQTLSMLLLSAASEQMNGLRENEHSGPQRPSRQET